MVAGVASGRGMRYLIALALLVPMVEGVDLEGIPGKHLIVSTPSSGKVWWSNNTQDIADPADVELVLDWRGRPMVPQLDMHLLVTPADVTFPMGLAVERIKESNEHGYEVIRRYLYVADPGSECEVMHVLRFPLLLQDGVFSVGEKQVVMQDKCVRWIAVDTVGNLYATCEETGEILKVPAQQIKERAIQPPPVVLYSMAGPNGMQVSGPGGIAADAFNVYWSNKVVGGLTGSVVRGNSFRPAGFRRMPAVSVIARNADAGRDYGVCVAGQQVFYTEKDNFLYATETNGGPIAVISDELTQPRGCAWDRDGTIYVADKAKGRIYAFPSSTRQLRTVGKLKRVATIEDPFAVVVVDRAAATFSGVLSLALVLAVALVSAGP